MSRMQRRKPWYKKPAGICGIAAAVLVIVGLVLFFALRGSGQKEPEVPDDTQVEVPDNTPEPTPEPEPEPEPEPTPTPDPKPNPVSDTTIYTEGEQTDGVWNLILVNPWNLPCRITSPWSCSPSAAPRASTSAAIPSCRR